MTKRLTFEPHPTAATSSKRAGARRHSGILRRSLLGAMLFIAPLQGSTALARSGSGYGDLVDSYCLDRGRLRVRAHQGHCAMCHHLGTFDSAPEHRVEPNWTEFERGRSGASFDFFCPGGSASSQVPTSAAADQRAAAEPGATPTMPQTARDASPMGMPPAMPTEPGSMQAKPPVTQDGSGQAATAPTEQGLVKPQAQSTNPLPPAELSSRLSTLHDTVGIKPGQEPAWREFIDAMAATTQRKEIAAGASEPAARLKARERDLSARIVALRAAGTAMSRLGAVLSETQRRALSDGVVPLLDGM